MYVYYMYKNIIHIIIILFFTIIFYTYINIHYFYYKKVQYNIK